MGRLASAITGLVFVAICFMIMVFIWTQGEPGIRWFTLKLISQL